jgi:transcriptional regulator of heat shock response
MIIANPIYDRVFKHLMEDTDFVATIQTKTGEYKKAPVEVQKSFANVDIMRFRNYLAEEYKREDITNDKQKILPVITIYILGDIIPEIDTACVRVNREYYDAIHFEQKYFIDSPKIYKDYKHVFDCDKNIRRIIDILHYCANEVEERKQIEAEHEAWRVYYALLKNELEKMNEQTLTIVEKDAIIEKDAALVREQEEKKRIFAEKEALIAELNALKNHKNT